MATNTRKSYSQPDQQPKPENSSVSGSLSAEELERWPVSDSEPEERPSSDDLEKWPVLGEQEESLRKQEEGSGVYDSNDKSNAENQKHKSNQKNESLKDREEKASKQENDSQSSASPGQTGSKKSSSPFGNFFSNRPRTIIIGATAIGGMASLAAIFFFAIAPFKIQHLVTNLQNRFYSSADNAVQKQTSKMFANYLRISLKCRASPVVDINTNCSALGENNTLVKRLYRGWWEGKIEQRMAQNGVEFRYQNGRYNILFNGRGGTEVALGDPESNTGFFNPNDPDANTLDDFLRSNGDMQPATRNQIRVAALNAFKAETRYDKVMYRTKVGRFLESKYGIKRCIAGCFGSATLQRYFDDWQDYKQDKRLAAKMWLAERVLPARYEIYSLMMSCIYAASSVCDKENVINAAAGEYEAGDTGCQRNCAKNGLAQSNTDKVIEAKLIALVATYGSDRERLRNAFDRFERYGFIGGFLREFGTNRIDDIGDQKGGTDSNVVRVISKVGSRATQLIPFIGWALLAAEIVDTVDNLPDVLPKLQYVTNSTAMVQMFSMYRTHADEIKEGRVDAAIVGSFVDSLGPGLQPTDRDGQIVDVPASAQKGGTAGAEGTPLYNAILGNAETKTKFSTPPGVAGFFFKKASAQPIEPYICADGDPVDEGKLVCSEENLRQKGWITEKLGMLQQMEGWSVLADIAGLLNTFNRLVNGVVGFICSIPGIDVICGGLAQLFSELLDFAQKFGPLRDLFEQIIVWMLGEGVNLIDNNMSGGRTFDVIAGGADVSGNEFAHNGIGGRVLSNQELADILSEQKKLRYESHMQKSFFARVFDKESEFSSVSNTLAAMPTSFAGTFNYAVGKFFSNPFDSFGGVFANLLSPKANAFDVQVAEDPFGVIQYGYPLNDPIYTQDPDSFWVNNCTTTDPNKKSLTQLYNEYAALNLDDDPTSGTSIPINDRPDPNNPGLPDDPVKAAAKAELARQILAISPTGTNGCLLIQTAAGSAGALYTDGVLSQEEIEPETPAGAAGGGAQADCSTFIGTDPSTWGDQSPGPAGLIAPYVSYVEQYAPGRACPGSMFPNFQTPSGAIPNDPNRQYYANCSDNCALRNVRSEADIQACGGGPWRGPGNYIRVKFRNPPYGGNTICIPVFATSNTGGTTPVPSDPPGGTNPPPGGCGLNKWMNLDFGFSVMRNPFNVFGINIC